MIFVKGLPSAIQKMEEMQLKRFILFIMRIISEDSATLENGNLSQPPWWPSLVTYEKCSYSYIPLIKWTQNDMKSIIMECYKYYDHEISITFSKSLSDLNINDLKFVTDDLANKTSIVYKPTQQVLIIVPNKYLVSFV